MNNALDTKLSLSQRRCLAFIGSKHHDWPTFCMANFGDFFPTPRTATYNALANAGLTTIKGGMIALANGVSVEGIALN